MGKKPSEVEFRLFSVSISMNLRYFAIKTRVGLITYCVLLLTLAQFGPSSFGPQHGFARISRWTLERAPERLHNGDVEAVFSLMDSEFTRSMWNFP